MGRRSSVEHFHQTPDLDHELPEPLAAPPPRRASSRSPLPRRATRAVGYLRRSTDRQEQSIPDQQRAVEAFAHEQGLHLLRCYIDDAISGTSTVGRRAFQQMIEDARSPSCDFGVVIVYDVKRFGRIDNDEAGYYRHVLRQAGVEVLYASEGFTGDGTDDLLRPVKQWQARQESKDLAKVAIRGLVSKATIRQRSGTGTNSAGGVSGGASGGFWMGGAPPYGYDLRYQSQAGEFLFDLRYQRDGTKQVLDQRHHLVRTLARGESISVSKRDRCTLVPSDRERVKTIESIFRLYIQERKGLKAIADQLNRDGVPTARGPEWSSIYSGQWAMSTVRAILVNPAYAGDLAWNRRTDARFFRIAGDGRAIERKSTGAHGLRRLESNDPSDWIVTEDAHPPLVPRRVFQQAQKLLKHAAEQFQGATLADSEVVTGGWSGPRARFLLSGLVRCSRCQSRYEGCTDPSGRKTDDGTPRSKCYSYACGGYIRRGKSVCRRGAVPQAQMEEAVVDAVLKCYKGLGGAEGRKRLSALIAESVGAERERATVRQGEIEVALEHLDATVRNLLDNLTAANRSVADQRLRELQAERKRLETEAEDLERATLKGQEVRALTDETARFIAGLEATLRESPVVERQAAIRRCLESVVFDREAGSARVMVRKAPLVLGGPKARGEAVVSQVTVKVKG